MVTFQYNFIKYHWLSASGKQQRICTAEHLRRHIYLLQGYHSVPHTSHIAYELGQEKLPDIAYELSQEKICVLTFRPGQIQTRLYSPSRWLG